MASPRLAAQEPFILLDPASLPVTPRQAASIKGAAPYGHPIGIADLEPVDLVIAGCVAVSSDSWRLGKGGGFGDLRYALAWEAGLINRSTVVATTVHEVQVVDNGRIPITVHDVRLDVIVTPDRFIVCCRPQETSRTSPRIHWDELTEEKSLRYHYCSASEGDPAAACAW